MSNDRNDNFDHEESEYHFTDDDAGFEIEPEAAKTSAAPIARENIFSRLTRSKRMLISIGVFLVLVFVAYKLVTPATSTVPSTDIAAAQPTQAMTPQVPVVASNQQPMQQMQQVQPVAQTMPVAQTAPVQPMQQSGIPPQTSIVPQTLPPQTAAVSQPQMQQMPAPTQMQQPYAQQQPVMQQPQTVATMPVQSISTDGTQMTQPMPQIDPNVVAANSERAMAQMQADYQAKLNDYSVQNKAILDQLQSLAAKVSSIESQMNAVTQNVGRSNPLVGPSSNAAPVSAPMPQSMAAPSDDVAPRIAYNVQAIIPGRAWLKSDNGETVTVAEGDVVRDLGRISKIDPYDGIVEINTGRKVITLSYGNVG